MYWLKQSTAVTLKIGPFVDATDGNTAETALTISQADVRLSKNGGNIAQKNEATSCTHDELGMYDCPLDSTDTNTLGQLDLIVAETGALIVKHSYMVVPANVWDSLFGADKLQVHVDEMTAGIITATVIADNAIDAGAIAADAITAAKIADGAIDANTFATGAITAGAIAADAIGASELATDAVNEIAEGLLNYNLGTGTDSGSATVRTVRQALRFLRNKFTLSAGTLTVYKEDDTTASWTSAVTTDAAANPVTASDPASS